MSMVAAFYYDRSDQRQALLPAGAVQCLRGAQQTPTLAAWWNAGNRWPNLVQLQSGTQISGALLMMGTTDDLTRALAYAGGVNDIDGISCTDDWLVAFYVRCYIAGTGVLGLAGRNYTVVSVAPLYKYWGHTRQSL